MKKTIDQLLDEARGATSQTTEPTLPPGFATRVVAHWQAAQRADARANQLERTWTRTCLAGVGIALLGAAYFHFQAIHEARVKAALAMVLITENNDSE